MNWSNYDPTKALEGAGTCPHCGGTAQVSPDDELRAKCDLCGGPRIEVDGVALSKDVERPLKAARAAQNSQARWRAATALGGGVGTLGALSTIVLLMWLGIGFFSGLAFAFGTLPWLALAAVGLRRGRAQGEVLREKLDDAWRLAARDVLAEAPHGLTAAELAERLELSEHQAETVIAELSLDGAVRSRITDDGRQVLSASKGARIETPVGDPLAEKFAALEEAMAEEEASAGQKKMKR